MMSRRISQLIPQIYVHEQTKDLTKRKNKHQNQNKMWSTGVELGIGSAETDARKYVDVYIQSLPSNLQKKQSNLYILYVD